MNAGFDIQLLPSRSNQEYANLVPYFLEYASLDMQLKNDQHMMRSFPFKHNLGDESEHAALEAETARKEEEEATAREEAGLQQCLYRFIHSSSPIFHVPCLLYFVRESTRLLAHWTSPFSAAAYAYCLQDLPN